jgi:hypothetical protein
LYRARLIGFLIAAIAGATAAVAAVHAASKPSAARCGGNLWHLKTLSDPGRGVVSLRPKNTTIGAVAKRALPPRLPLTRKTPFQRQTWMVVAQIVQYRMDGGELRLVLFDDGAYINAAIPSPSCLPASTRNRAAMVATWTTFTTRCGRPTETWRPLGAVAFISGVGYWSQRRTQQGTAPNGAELHPVTGLRTVAGCTS